MKARLPLVLSLFAVSLCRGQDAAKMDFIVRSYADAGKFMGSVLVAKDGAVLFSKGYGSADLSWKIPNTPDTKFRLGSLTKQFTAASILLLEERGKLKVEDPVKKYIPDAPAAWDKITIFNLLTHTSGIPNYTGLKDYQETQGFATTPQKLVARFKDLPLEFEPGAKWNYSNSGYALLGYIIERVSGEKYSDFVQKNLFDVLGMADSGYDSNSRVIAGKASGYVPGPDGPVNAAYIDMTVPFSAGGLFSSADDLLRWETGLFGGKLLSAASLKKMTTPFRSGYAFGLGVREPSGKKEIGHGGAINGFNTWLAYYPESRITVAVLANLNGPACEEIGGYLGQIALGHEVVLPSDRKAIVVGVDTLRPYVGTYEFSQGYDYYVTLDRDQLMGRLGNQASFPLYPQTPTYFFLKAVDAQIEFTKDKDGSVTSLTLHQGGQDHLCKRISSSVVAPATHTEINLSPDVMRKYVGTYQLGAHTELNFTLDGEQLSVQLTGQPMFPVFPEAENKFFLKVVDAQLEFVRNADGSPTAVILHQNGLDQKAPRE